MKSLRLLVAIALAAMLLSAQQAAALHALSHLGDAPGKTEQQKRHAGEKVCDQCLVFATVHGGGAPGLLFIAFVDRPFHFHSGDALSATVHRTAPYRSRAPPSLS